MACQRPKNRTIMKCKIITRTLGLFALLVFAMPGCAPKKAVMPEDEAAFTWQAFAAKASAAEKGSGPYRISSNLRYSVKGESQRVSGILWSNATDGSPLRLDLVAGVGNIVAMIREDEQGFTAYVPSEKTAYVHPGGSRALTAFGVPIPLTLHDLAMMASGRSGTLLLADEVLSGGRSAVPEVAGKNGDEVLFSLGQRGLGGFLELTQGGVPVFWSEHADAQSGWKIAFELPDGGLRFKRLRITHPDGYEALVVVKDVEYLPTVFSQSQLELGLPKNIAVKPIYDDV